MCYSVFIIYKTDNEDCEIRMSKENKNIAFHYMSTRSPLNFKSLLKSTLQLQRDVDKLKKEESKMTKQLDKMERKQLKGKKKAEKKKAKKLKGKSPTPSPSLPNRYSAHGMKTPSPGKKLRPMRRRPARKS
jgi:hypothetical protein